MKQIIVTIDQSGGVTVETKGFAGKECLQATAQLEAALGAVRSITPTEEMKQEAGQRTTLQVKS